MTQSPRDRFGLRFALLARRWRRALDSHLAAQGLSDATWVPLVHLREQGDGITQKALAALIGLDGSSLVRLLDILGRQGLIERRIDPNDARARLIFLTPEGRDRVATIRAELTRAEAAMLEGIPDEDLALMMRHFETIEQRITAMQDGPDQGTAT